MMFVCSDLELRTLTRRISAENLQARLMVDFQP